MGSTSALAGLVIASAGVGLQWARFWNGQDISEPIHLPLLACPACPTCPPRFEASVPERRLLLLELVASPDIWLELLLGYLIGLHLLLGFLLCRYGSRRCCPPAARRRVGVKSRIEVTLPARASSAGELRDGSGVAP